MAKLELIQAASRGPVYAPSGKLRPVQRTQRGVNPVEVAAPVRREETVGQADLVDGEPGVALQVQGLFQVYLEVAVRAGHSLAAVHVDGGHAFSKEATRSADDGRVDGCDGGAAGDILALRVDQCGTSEQLLAQEAERRSHRLLSPERNALRSASRTFRSSASGSRRKGSCKVPASPARTTGRAAPLAAGR